MNNLSLFTQCTAKLWSIHHKLQSLLGNLSYSLSIPSIDTAYISIRTPFPEACSFVIPQHQCCTHVVLGFGAEDRTETVRFHATNSQENLLRAARAAMKSAGPEFVAKSTGV